MTNIKIEHIIFTPFCSNRYDEWKIGIGRTRQPPSANTRSTDYLESRLRYLEAVCFPSLAGQYNQDFKWILAIDPDLPEHFVHRLEALISQRPGSILHRIEDAHWERSEWILPYLSSNPPPTHLVTTNLDSDDGLDRRFTEFLRDFLVSKSTNRPLPPILTLGYRDAVQWDLDRSLLAPYGYKSKWHRGKGQCFLSPGCTVVAQYPDYPVLVTGLRHVVAHNILDFSIEDPEKNSPYSMRRHACDSSNDIGGDLESWPVSKTAFTLEDKLGLPLMLNHENTLMPRLKEKKPERRRVWRSKSIPNVALDWDRLWQ